MTSMAESMMDLYEKDYNLGRKTAVEASWLYFLLGDEVWLVYRDYSTLIIDSNHVTCGEIRSEDFQSFLVDAVNALGMASINSFLVENNLLRGTNNVKHDA